MASESPITGLLTSIAEALGISSSSSGDDLPPPVEVALDIRVPRENNEIWNSFDSFEVILTELQFHGTHTASISTGVQFDLRDETFVDGDELAWGMQIEPGSYERLTGTFEVAATSLADEATDRPVEGFDSIELMLDTPWTPDSHDEWRFTLTTIVRTGDDAYVLDPAVEWERESAGTQPSGTAP